MRSRLVGDRGAAALDQTGRAHGLPPSTVVREAKPRPRNQHSPKPWGKRQQQPTRRHRRFDSVSGDPRPRLARNWSSRRPTLGTDPWPETHPIDGSLPAWEDVEDEADWKALLLGNGLSVNV